MLHFCLVNLWENKTRNNHPNVINLVLTPACGTISQGRLFIGFVCDAGVLKWWRLWWMQVLFRCVWIGCLLSIEQLSLTYGKVMRWINRSIMLEPLNLCQLEPDGYTPASGEGGVTLEHNVPPANRPLWPILFLLPLWVIPINSHCLFQCTKLTPYAENQGEWLALDS